MLLYKFQHLHSNAMLFIDKLLSLTPNSYVIFFRHFRYLSSKKWMHKKYATRAKWTLNMYLSKWFFIILCTLASCAIHFFRKSIFSNFFFAKFRLSQFAKKKKMQSLNVCCRCLVAFIQFLRINLIVLACSKENFTLHQQNRVYFIVCGSQTILAAN